MKYRHIFWDWNGTLFNDTVLCHEITNILLEEIGVEKITYDYYRKTLRHPIKEFYDEVTKTDCAESYAWFSEKFHEYYEQKRFACGIHSHAEDNITFFKSMNASQSILSAHPQYLLDSIITHLGIGPHFDHIIGASDKLATNKFKEGERLMTLCSADPSKTLIIGDTQHDAEVAELLGIDCILVTHGMQCSTKLSHLKVPMIDSLEKLKDIIAK